ncbi:hemolysin secretion protein D [PVC group bacterium (ex Bugula neritina AB1)]|nr:hemolysin secretion protein D [PVC group bacterium (ex Bugula neritina AB1)]
MYENVDKKKAGMTKSVLFWVIFFAFMVFVYWTYAYSIEQVVRGAGEVIAKSRVQVIQSVDGGVLESLFVQEGDSVEAGQVLAHMETERISSAVNEIEAKLASLYAHESRLKSEINNLNTVSFPSEVDKYPDVVLFQRLLFNQRTKAFKEEMEVLEKAVSLAEEELKLTTSLKSKGDVSRLEVLRVEGLLNNARSQLINRRNAYFRSIHEKLAEVEDLIGQNEQIRQQRIQQRDDTILKAPVRGIVRNIKLTTPGAVLRGGEELMNIVPLDDELIVEVNIRPADIAGLRPGMFANINFDAYDYTIYGGISGEVVYVSADTLKEETRFGEQTYYRVYVKLPESPFETRIGRTIEVSPGMTAQVSILTGNRRVIDFILKPIRKTLSEAGGEK